jgi:hypothetical protein
VSVRKIIPLAFALVAISGFSGYIVGDYFGRASQALKEKRIQDRLASASFKSDLFADQISDAVSRLARVQRVQSQLIVGSYKVELLPYPEDNMADVCVVLLPTHLGVGGDATYCYRANSKVPEDQWLGE